MRYVFLLLILFNLGCQQQGGNYQIKTLGEPADFSIFVNQLNSDLAKIGKDPLPNNIKYYAWNEQGFSSYNLDGYCSKDSYGNPAVSLNVDMNDIGVSDYVMFVHEIGHCVYGKHHEDGGVNIMNAVRSADMRSMFLDEPTRLQLIKEMIEN